MDLKFIILVFVIFQSCSSQIKESDIFTSWKMIDIVHGTSSHLSLYNFDICSSFRDPNGNNQVVPSKSKPFETVRWELFYNDDKSFIKFYGSESGEFDGDYLIDLQGVEPNRKLKLISTTKAIELWYEEYTFTQSRMVLTDCGLHLINKGE